MNTLKQRNYSDLDQFITDADLDTDMNDILLDLEMMQTSDIDQELTEYYQLTNQGE